MTKSLPSNNSKTILELKNISKTYCSNDNLFYALNNVSIKIKEGEYIAITGPSGSGKSTLMHIIGLLDNPSSGDIFLNNKNISKLKENQLAQLRNTTLGFVFQQFNLLPKTSALENVTLPLLYSDIPRKEHNEMGIKILEKVGLGDKLKNTPAQLSGGQQQRVAIARALINNPQIIFADEPTGISLMKLFKQLHDQEKKTIILVTHDLSLAKNAKRMIVIKDGQIANK
jgi:putative ABC transport system ATP-binding protein